ncbi:MULTISPECIES: response regulator [unclassified Nitratiruptor]|uniref:response regulator n=1 Tax=unclassified Nitratiruptor TaxID=2624044 RepID=UPI00191669C5|nr:MULTISPECIES: response regulator [unclassified Nitratiruptor]BCD59815.1 two-component system, OmpR family, response regulator [Nitratiruptor sp. YY08-10]BCD63739.1 two-component system response regulator [Nitratiruptor sp. YY08-14]
MKKRILIVEDESLVAFEIQSALEQVGFDCTAITDDANDAIEAVRKSRPDVIIMDIYLANGTNGIDACRMLKKEFDIPIIFLTAYSDQTTLREALDCQPDGYLIKPFRRPELYAAINLALGKNRFDNTILELCKGVQYDKNRSVLKKEDQEIALTKKERELLHLLLQNRGKLVSFERIEYELWPQKPVSETTRRTLIHRLRSKLSKDCLKSVPGIGCMLQ